MSALPSGEMNSALLTGFHVHSFEEEKAKSENSSMGRKFKLSDMIPNAWFYKLRDMGVLPSNKNKLHVSLSHSSTSSSWSAITRPSDSRPNQPLPRKSYHFTRKLGENDALYDSSRSTKFSDTHLAEPQRKSSKQRDRTRTAARSTPNLVGSSVSAGCSCGSTLESVSDSLPEFSSSPFDSSPDGKIRTDTVLATESLHGAVTWTASKANSCVCKTNLNDIIIDDNNDCFTSESHTVGDLIPLPNHELPPINTKPATFTDMVGQIKKKDTKNPRNKKSSVKMEEMNSRRSLSVRITKEEKIAVKEQRSSLSRKFSVNSPGVRLRINSPRIGSRKINGRSGRKSISSSSTCTSSGSNKSLSDSLAIMKSSFDPQRDFRESMVEMIVENNIRASKDLEDLLACYLSLNADEYHDLIIKVFKEIWFDLPNARVT